MTVARVMLWGRQIGAVEWDDTRAIGVFQYTPDFAASGIEVAPITMPLTTSTYSFPAMKEALHGLPGLLADSLPDKYGHRLIDAWLASEGRPAGSLNPVERLCYIGHRGMGALEFEPTLGRLVNRDRIMDIPALTRLANEVLAERAELSGLLDGRHDAEALQDILRVGTSAGGARAKALLAWNPDTGEFRSGQLDGLPGFTHWLLKFDGVSNNRDKEIADPLGYGKIEYAYYLMACSAGIQMTQSRLHLEGGRHHFMTRRFDRTDQGKKLHMQSLAALCHYDYNDPSSYSYEQAMHAIRQVSSFAQEDCEQQFLRTVFNIVGRNQDDHVKNIAFLMNPAGKWRLSPGFDLTYAWNPQGNFTGRHQMSVNGKRDGFVHDDLLALARSAGIKPQKARVLINEVTATIRRWAGFAEEAGIDGDQVARIGRAHRLDLAPATTKQIAG